MTAVANLSCDGFVNNPHQPFPAQKNTKWLLTYHVDVWCLVLCLNFLGLKVFIFMSCWLFGLLQGSAGQYDSRRREFEAWLCRENELLSGILRSKGEILSAKELKMRQDTLKVSSRWIISYCHYWLVIIAVHLEDRSHLSSGWRNWIEDSFTRHWLNIIVGHFLKQTSLRCLITACISYQQNSHWYPFTSVHYGN